MALFITSIVHIVSWRWQHIGGLDALIASLFFLWPAWANRWTRTGIGLYIMILFGYGNVKYLLLLYPFIFEEMTTTWKAKPRNRL